MKQLLRKRWEPRGYLAFFRAWARKFDREFRLGIDPVTIAVAPLPTRVLGQYRHRGGEVILSAELVSTGDMFKILGVLLHELLHAAHCKHGTPGPNHHDAEFRAMARACGLIVTEDGFQTYQPGGRFVGLMKAHGVLHEGGDL